MLAAGSSVYLHHILQACMASLPLIQAKWRSYSCDWYRSNS